MSLEKNITIEGHDFEIVTEQSSGTWSVEVVNSVKSAFAFDPSFESEAEAVAHAQEALRSRDIADFLG
ncbi:hypothetical protein [Planktotalea sp.]|uniref:hypothetical protein n=1 Tax=Planktotalea sp. TaxID=2029877 RepID=UPI003D6A959E